MEGRMRYTDFSMFLAALCACTGTGEPGSTTAWPPRDGFPIRFAEPAQVSSWVPPQGMSAPLATDSEIRLLIVALEKELARTLPSARLDQLVVEDGHEVIRSAGGAMFEEVGLRFASNIGHLDRSYEFHVPFTDGGVLLYTGHLEVRSQAGSLDTELVLSGRPDEHIWVAGAVHDTWVQRSEGEGFGTYAYFGSSVLEGSIESVLLAGTILCAVAILPLLFPRSRRWITSLLPR